METYKLVMPENLNHYGMLFGGYMLKWVDEIAWVAATLEYPDHRFVTIGMDRVEFRHGVKQGTILRFEVTRSRVGNTSVSYLVNVYRDHETNPDNSIFTTTVTMVNVDDFGNKTPI
jgi:acyl-CoA hydrolase